MEASQWHYIRFLMVVLALALSTTEATPQDEGQVRRAAKPAIQQQLQQNAVASMEGNRASGKWERAGRKAYVAKDVANGVDVADMGGVEGKASKMAAFRMWLDGKSAPSKGPEPAGEAFLGDLPYVLVIVGGGILLVVLIAVTVLRRHQPRSTSYFSPSYSKEIMKGQKPR